MAESDGPAAPLCSERFGSRAARGCCGAADGRLRWEAWGALSGDVTAKAEGRHGGAAGAPGPASPLASRLLAVVLPQGFPGSVSPDYLPYQLWDSVQAFASSLSGSLATHAVLLGIGVGDAHASVSAATATWLVKDSTGMLGRIVFAWWKGSKLDCNAKQWRLFADILNDVAMFLEIMAPMYPSGFTVIICISNLAKCIVSVAGGATRAALTMHQARRNNMADVSAKDSSQVILDQLLHTKGPGEISLFKPRNKKYFPTLDIFLPERGATQETLVNLAGLLISLLLLPLVSDCPSFNLGCFFFLTALHIYANYRAVRALVIETLNEGRLWLVLKHFLQRGEVLDPTSANQMEPLWTGFWPALSLSLGVPLHRLISRVSELQQLVDGHQEPYLLHWDQLQNQVQVVLSHMAGPETILRAATHGLVLGALQEEWPLPAELEELRHRVQAGPEKESWVIVKETHQVLHKLFPKFLKGLQDAGWKTEKHQMEVDEWRATWLPSPEKKVL